jgi:hypothetical protein
MMQRAILSMAVLGSLVEVAHAQTPATSFAEVASRLRMGETVIATTEAGEAVRGKVEDVTDTTLLLRRRQDERTFSASDVRRIERPTDTLWNGALAGLAVGFGVGALAASVDDCRGLGAPCFSGGFAFAAGGMTGLMGMGVGAVVDALIHRERLVFVRAGTKAARRRMAPFTSGTDVRVSFTF